MCWKNLDNIEKKLITTEYASESSDYECYFSDVSLEYLTDSGHDFDPDEVTFESKRFNPCMSLLKFT